MRGDKTTSWTLLQNGFKQWKAELYVDKTIGQLRVRTEVRTPRIGSKILSRWITKTCHSKYSFALIAH